MGKKKGEVRSKKGEMQNWKTETEANDFGSIVNPTAINGEALAGHVLTVI
jgi:hypothetical protein